MQRLPSVIGVSLKRIPQHEVLDSDLVSPQEAVESLADLRWVNRWFGGVSTTAFLLRRAMRKSGLRSASVLEVAAGDGYSIVHAARRLKNEDLEVSPLCLDRREVQAPAHCCDRAVVGDALQLTFPPASFDFVSCGLFVHHLAPAQVIGFINGALKAARHAVLINDLRRSSLHLAMVYAGMPIFRSPISYVDGLASVRQAYTPEELREMIRQTNATSLELRTRYLFRMGAIAWK
jgi:2-polyprenyl-3-methyl-5-hydroxy-6-metoxy-1,4-benzoquinol methylase